MTPGDIEMDDDIRKFEEIGTHPAANYLAIADALTFHQGIGAKRKEERLRYLTSYWAERLLVHDRVKLNTNLDPEGQRIPRSASNKIILARAVVSNPKLLLLEDPLDHVPAPEKEVIIQNLTKEDVPWSIIITAVDKVWTKYIDHEVVMNDGKIISDTFLK